MDSRLAFVARIFIWYFKMKLIVMGWFLISVTSSDPLSPNMLLKIRFKVRWNIRRSSELKWNGVWYKVNDLLTVTAILICFVFMCSVFNTNTNQTVIQTYNATTYRNCTTDYASDDDTFQYQGGSNEFGEAMTVTVSLTLEGQQYYFSDADDGSQCLNGMAFDIKVRHGIGLPPSLNQPPPPPYVEPPSTVEDAESPPITVVTSSPNGGVRSSARLFLAVFVLVMLVLHLV